MTLPSTVRIATRGSALALTQARLVQSLLQGCAPSFPADLRVIKTTGDKLQTASLANPDATLPRGLFTKELELALLQDEADVAVHSLKDLPTDLPVGLQLAAVTEREDVRDVLLFPESTFRKAGRSIRSLRDLPAGLTVATSSNRRAFQILAIRPDLKTVPIRGNVGTRLKKLSGQQELGATILALAGLNRLGIQLRDEMVSGADIPPGLRFAILGLDEMLPAVGQGAIGLECRVEPRPGISSACRQINHAATFHAVLAERAFLQAMGGGCQSPVAAFAECAGTQIRMRAVSFMRGTVVREEIVGNIEAPVRVGQLLAARILEKSQG